VVTDAPFPHLFEPLRLRHVTLRNRVVFGAHTANMAEQGLPGARHLAYYLERARGGASMIVVEPVPVHPTAVLTRGNFRPGDDRVIAGFRAITDVCHAEGSVMVQQLYHVGQHGDFDNSFRPSWSPSGLPSYHDAEGSHAMAEAEIEDVIGSFVEAAVRAKASGFDGVEIFAAYHALVDQFWLPWSNRRDDRWGASFDDRMRFSSRVLGGIRDTVGDDFVIGLAVSIDPSTDVTLSRDELCTIVAWHDERRLMDYVTCGTGSYFNFAEIMPTHPFAPQLGVDTAAALKRVVHHARVQAESHIRTAANAEEVIASGAADMVSIVRGQIADPYLVTKAHTGRADDVRTCISCNQMCWGRRSRDYWISCLVNPSAGREAEWGGDRIVPADEPRTVLVIGGGPAGLEAARVAAERGHRVTLVEAEAVLGGAFRYAGKQPRRGQILDLLTWYERQLRRLEVDVRLDRRLDAEQAAALGADHIVVATGSGPARTGFQRRLPAQDALPGVEWPGVLAVEEVMSGRAEVGQRVVVLDDTGDWRGGGTAWHLAELGHAVVVVTGYSLLGVHLQRAAADGTLRSRLATLGVSWRTDTVATAWSGDALVVRSLLDGRTSTVEADTLVLATTNIPNATLADDLTAHGRQPHLVGDAVAARLAVHAIYEGRTVAMAL
jgi:2,4-dienoyl-CoA reductase-like NADH-dependent reductase (Old Yellow Enzyme family)/thioredoxin reductase